MNKKQKNRQIAKITVFITSVFVIFLSMSYAFVTSVLTGDKSLVINSGVLDLVLEEDKALTLENALPMYDEVGMIQEDVFNFRIINNTSNATNYTLTLNKISTDNELSTDIVKYYLTKDGVGKPKFLSELNEDNVVDTGTILGSTTINYSLRLWIDSSVEDDTLVSGKSLSYMVSVEAGQTIESHMTDVLVTGTEFKNSIPDSVTKVVFTDEVAPEGVSLTDLSANKDMSIVAWTDSTTYKVSTQREGVYIQGNPDSSWLFFKNNRLTDIDFTYFKTDYIENMKGMFALTTSLSSLDLSSWNTSKVKNMSVMFSGDSPNAMNLTSLDISTWDTSNVENMGGMFQHCSSLTNLDLSNWDTSNVKTMRMMFGGNSSNRMKLTSLDLSNWDTSSVEDMAGMFQGCSFLTNLDVSNWNVSNVKDMESLFNYCSSLTELNVSNWDVSNVTSMRGMFQDCNFTTLDISNWNIKNVEDNAYMFNGCSKLENIVVDDFNLINKKAFNFMTSYSSETFTVSKSVNSISKSNPWYDFGTSSFKGFVVDSNNKNFKVVDDILYTSDGDRLIAVPKGKMFENNTFEIPEGVTFIDEFAFSKNTSVKKVVIPNSYEIKYYTASHVDYDKDNQNKGSNLSIGIYSNTSVNEYAVKEDNPNYIAVDGCIYSKDGSKLVAIPSNYQSTLNVKEGTTKILKEALFETNSLKEINIPASVTSIDSEFITIVNSASDLVINVDSSNSNYTVSDGKLVVK